jgi:hypothetical protein
MIGQITLSNFAAVALFVVTAILAYFTWENSNATKRLAEAETNPLVYIDMEWDDIKLWASDLRIFIKNVGRSPASDIDFVYVNDDFALSAPGGGDPPHFKTVWYVENGVRGLAPDRELTITRVTRKAVDLITKPVDVKLAYKNAQGDLIDGEYTLDFPGYMRMR